MTSNKTLAMLLSADRGKLKLVPKKTVEITRLSEVVGEPVLFEIRALTGEEFQEAREMAFGVKEESELDLSTYQMLTLLRGVIDPSLKDKGLMEIYGAHTPEDLILRSGLLLPGELSRIFTAIQELSGFNDESVQEIKN